jgi:hypothetical protein
VRLAELGTVYRYERSGVLHGLLRVRGFTQDDAHIFCTPSQIEKEVEDCVDFAFAVMKNFGFDKFEVELSDWDAAHPENYAGKPEDWHRASAALANTMQRLNIPYKTIQGEAGPGSSPPCSSISIFRRASVSSTSPKMAAATSLSWFIAHCSAQSSVSSASSSSTTLALFRCGSHQFK